MTRHTFTPADILYQQNYKEENKAAQIIAANVVMLASAYVAVALRFLSRRMSHTTLQADDWMIMAGLVLTSCFVAGIFVCVSFGLGKHVIFVTKPVPFAQAILTTEVLYTPASTCIKFSILLLYRRIFPSKRLKKVLQCLAGFLTIFALAQMLSVIIQCTPVSALWNPTAYPDAHCSNYTPALILFAAVNATTDIIILCVPMPILWRLHVSKTRRQQLIFMFSLGGLVCVVSICRAGYVGEVSLADPSWDDVNTVILSSVENCAGVISACLPIMLPIARFFRHGSKSSTTQIGSTSRQQPGIKMSSLKQKLKSRSQSGHLDQSEQDGSFTRLQNCEKGTGSDRLIHASDQVAVPSPYVENAIRITTELKQTRGVAPDKHATAKTRTSGW